jgi:RNA polymerase sigma-70 factor (ECF subfamily)
MNVMSESFPTTESVTDDGIKRENFEREAIPYLDLLYRYGLRLTGDSQQAEDLVQNTMLKAYRSWHQYQMGTNVRAWLVTILRNCFIKEYRKASRAGVHIDVKEIEEFYLFEGVQENPEGLFFDQIVDDEILRAIDELPDEFRETLVLSDMEALSYVEISKVTRVPLGTVKSRLFRARRALRRKLSDYAVAMGYIRQAALAEAC